MSYTIGTAAKATGKAKSTISRDVKSGRISAQKQPDGSYLIDPSELHRVYPPVVFDNGSENTKIEQFATPDNGRRNGTPAPGQREAS